MQRRNQFITAVITAALTFGVLTFTLGQRHYDSWRGYRHGYSHHHDREDCGDHHTEKQKGESDSPQSEL